MMIIYCIIENELKILLAHELMSYLKVPYTKEYLYKDKLHRVYYCFAVHLQHPANLFKRKKNDKAQYRTQKYSNCCVFSG